jgi:hypothetical protein
VPDLMESYLLAFFPDSPEELQWTTKLKGACFLPMLKNISLLSNFKHKHLIEDLP